MRILKTGLLFLLFSFLEKANTIKSKKNLKNLFTGEIDLPSKTIPIVNEPLSVENAESLKTGFLQRNRDLEVIEYIDNNGQISYISPKYHTVKKDSLVPQIKLNLVINIENNDGDCESDKNGKTPGKGKGNGKERAKGKKTGLSSSGFPNGKIRVFLDGEDINEMSSKAEGKTSGKSTGSGSS